MQYHRGKAHAILPLSSNALQMMGVAPISATGHDPSGGNGGGGGNGNGNGGMLSSPGSRMQSRGSNLGLIPGSMRGKYPTSNTNPYPNQPTVDTSLTKCSICLSRCLQKFILAIRITHPFLTYPYIFA